MSKRYRARTARLMYALIVLVVLALAIFGWSVGRSVIAYRAEKTVHVFPTSVEGVGWEGMEKSLSQDLPALAGLTLFSPENSAFIYLDAVELPPELIIETVPTESVPEVGQSLEELSIELIEGADDASQNPPPATTSPEMVPPDVIDSTPQDPVMPGTSEVPPMNATSSDSNASSTSRASPNLFSFFTPFAFAQEDTDVGSAECVVLSVPCHTMEFSGFTVGGAITAKKLEGVAISFSFASPQLSREITDDMLIVRYYHQGEWRVASEVFLTKDVSNETNGGYFTAQLEDVEEWEDIPHLRVMLEFSDVTVATPAALYFDALWIDAVYRERVQGAILGANDEVTLPQNATDVLVGEDVPTTEEEVVEPEAEEEVAAEEELVPRPDINQRIDDRKNFKRDEHPEFAFKFKSQRNIFVRAYRWLRGIQAKPTIDEVVLVHRSGVHFFMPADITHGENGEWQVRFRERPNPLMPGEYTMIVKLTEDGYDYEDMLTFSWGVLAMNPLQSIYAPGETATVHLAALSPSGNTLCDANLTLAVIAPDGTESESTVIPSRLCDGNNVTDVPDYSASFDVGEVGTYRLRLTSYDLDGAPIAEIEDALEVRGPADELLVVKRTGPTRIYPLANYAMEIEITARGAFVGTFEEPIQKGFVISDTDGAYADDTLTWDVALADGETVTLRYVFDAPDKSPYLYTIGPARALDESGAVHEETRAWQIASDATGNMILLWPYSWTPTGWTCVSCAGGDPFYQRFIMGSSTYSGTGGAATHTHTASGSVSSAGTATAETRSGTGYSGTGHTHTYSPTIETVASLPPYRQLRVIRHDSAGEPADIPAGAIAIFDASVPSGWTRYSAQDSTFPRGESTIGTTGGSATHTHTVTGNTSAASGDAQGSRTGALSVATDVHTHSISTTTSVTSLLPPYLDVILGQIDATSTPPNSMIAMWSEDAPAGWNDVSDIGGDFNGRFIRGSASYGSTGGASTHTHLDIPSVTSSAAAGTATRRAGPPDSVVSSADTHPVSVTGFNSTSHLPPYIEVPFAKRLANTPVYTQHSFRFYANANAEPPTDPWPSGATNLAENEAVPNANSIKYGDILRLRMAVAVTNSTSTAGNDSFTLQYGEGSTCSAVSWWRDVGSISSTTALWRGYNNAGVTDGATVSSTTLAISDVFATYEEENDSATVPIDIGVGEYGEWDWVLQNNGATGGAEYCFRMIRSDDSALNTYTQYPKVIVNASPIDATHDDPFSNRKFASTTPSFDFYATDPEGESVNYQLQVSTDPNFGSTVVDINSVSNPTSFDNVLSPADKAPFNSGDRVRHTIGTTLSSGTTYWWRVRSNDPSGSNVYGEWSTADSFTTQSGITISTWFQTTDEQFDTGTLSGVESSGSESVELITGSSTGSLYSSAILFEWGEGVDANAWGELSWTDTETTGDIKYQVEFYDSVDEAWELVPDGDLTGNSSGFDTSPVSLLSMSPDTYEQIRLRANLTDSGGTPTLSDWTVEWGTRVGRPTATKLFDNEKSGTTTPTFEFTAVDPQSDDLMYEIQWSTDPAFGSGTTRASDTHAGFSNVTNPGDTDPFDSGNLIRFTMQAADALTNNTTYWWRVRAKDPAGGNAFSEWSVARSVTVDTTISVSTWFQTTDAQFDTDTLLGIRALAQSAQVATSVTDVLIAYGEGTVQTPRYRFWDGDSWGGEGSAESIGSATAWVITKAHPRANEYAMATMGTNGNIYAQIYRDGAWGDLQLLTTTVNSVSARGFDIAYEQSSGDLVATFCDGDADPSYRVFDGTTWSSANTVNLASASNCNWIKLAADPTSDEIIIASLPADGGQYEAQVWSGSAWGNSVTWGSMNESNEGIAIEYEASGGQAVVMVSNGNSPNIAWRAWDGASWTAAANVNTGGMETATLRRNVGTDDMALCFVDDSTSIETMRWTGSAWTGQTQLDGTANRKTDRPIDCAYETSAGRTNNIMAVYSDATNVRYSFWNGATWATEASVSTIEDAATVQLARSDDGLILGVFFDHTNGRYDFSYWNGSAWSASQTLESSPSVSSSPYKEPFMLAPRRSSTAGTIEGSAIVFSEGSGPKWGAASWTHSTPGSSTIVYQVEYLTASSTWALIPDSAIPNNSTGTSTGPISLDDVSTATYGTIRLVADLTCVSTSCPTLSDWTVTWSEGLLVSGTAQEYDQTTNVTSGTVAVAVNGSLEIGKTGTISAGTWSIANVTVFPGDVVTVFVDGAAASDRAVAVAKYDGTGDVTGLALYERHLTIGSPDNQSFANTDLALFDNSVSGDSDVFHDVDAGNDLSACIVAGCADVRLLVTSGNTYRPDSASSGNVSAHDIEIDGTLVADGNTLRASGSWDNNATFTANTSTVILTATSTTESIDSTGAASASFNNLTIGETSGTAVWNLATALDVNGTLSIQRGTLAMNGSNPITLASNLTIGANGLFAKGTATTTFDASGSGTWTDSSTPKQDFGSVLIDGTARSVLLGSGVRATNVTIGADDSVNTNGANTFEVEGNWNNTGSFIPSTGTVSFTATTTGRTITPGASSFNNLSFNGVGGNWAFTSSTITVGGNLTVATGTLTMPTGTTTVTGNFDASTGTFMHNNGTVLLNATAARTIHPGASSFYDLTFNASGSWSFTSTAATSSRHLIIAAGTVTAPSGTLAIGGSYAKNGGTFTHNSGTLRFIASSAQTLRLNSSDAYNLTFAGSGSWSFVDTNATTTNAVTIASGTLTLPSGVFAVGGSWAVSGGAFTHNSGTVKFNSSDTGETIDPGGSWFSALLFDSPGGGWTISESATSSATTTLSRGTSFTLASGRTLAIGGAFSTAFGGATTTWTGSSLYLYSGTSFTMNSKGVPGDSYGTLIIGANTDVKMWNSDAASTAVAASGSLYSQDHAGVDGSLYIWGEYVTAANEHWSYATDFDGTALGGSSRQANVRLAPGATVQFSSATLSIIGTAAATTTIANQGSGDYGISMSGGTLNAQYYEFRNLDSSGLSLTGTPSITSLANGDFELSANGGSLITLADTVIDANPALQIFSVSFATSSGITSGFNVTASGSPASNWWFRESYGNYEGENYDSDPGGNPGNIRWDDSGFSITVSGTVYADRGVNEMAGPTCDDSTPVVTVVVNGANPQTVSCDPADGYYEIPGVTFTGDATIAVYLDGAAERAVTVTRTPTADITGLDLYAGTLIVRHESVSPLTIANLALFDADDDGDVFFTATTTSPSLTVYPDHELHIWGGDTFAPAGDVTLESGGSGNSRDGRLHLASNSTFTAVDSESHSVGGDFVTESGASYSAASSSLTFTATTSKSITLATALTLWDVAFDGVGGSWNLSGATTTVQDTFAVTNGTLQGTGNIVAESGSISGDGAIAMTGGTVRVTGTGTIGGNTAWQFYNLILGDSTNVRTTSRTGTGSTTALGVLTVRTNHTFEAGSSPLVFAGSSTPFVVSGIFDVQTAPVFYTSTDATNIADEDYALLTLTPSGAGTPTYSFMGGVFSIGDLVIGGANPVIVTANANDPSMTVSGDVVVEAGSTLIASNVGALEVGGSWTMNGSFAHSNGEVVFDSTDTGETILPGNSPFYDVDFDGATGGWTLSAATTTRHFSLTNAASFTLQSGDSLSVGGTFTNAEGGGATNWTGTTLSLRSGTSYSANTKTAGGDDYQTLVVDTATDVRMWHSSASTTSVADTSSLYSQDHANVNGDLYIWGEYIRATGSDYWSYGTDFDGTSLSGSERQVDVRIASSSSIALTGGVLDILGASSASTTVAVQGSGAYSFSVSGGTLNAQYYQLRNLNASGLALSGSPTITSLSDGDFELAVQSGSIMTIAASVITANPVKIVQRVVFATSTGITSGTNVTATGSTASSWKFNFHYGDIDGESFDSDPAGDPGYIVWDDSAAQITIAGNVYSDEGTSVSAFCDSSTPQVRLMVQGVSAGFVSCDDTTGEYSFSNISYNPGDSFMVYLDGVGERAANISVDPFTNIADMHLYENRVIVRHEDTSPLTIADMAIYDSSDDGDIPFTAVDDVADTLTLPPETKLIVWNSKTFAPAGTITLQSGGSGDAWDGTLELLSGAQFSAAGTQTHSIGGSLLLDSTASIASAQSTFLMTATTTGKTIQPAASSFYDITFNGNGGNWAFAGPATTTDDFTITAGTVTLPSGTLAIGSSFDNTGGTFMHNNGQIQFFATAAGQTVRASGSNFYDLTFTGTGGAWTFNDTNATSSHDVALSAGAVTLPSGTFAVGSSFTTVSPATFAHGSGTIRFTASTAGKTLNGGASNFNNILFDGSGGEWTWSDATSTANSITIVVGSTTLPVALTLTGSFENTGGSFYHNGGTITFAATATGRNIRTSGSWFYALVFNSASGGWTILDAATTTSSFSLTAASSFTLSSGQSLSVGGAFTNAVGGAATTWTGSTLILSGTDSTVNTKAQSGDLYDTLVVGPSTDISMWNSSAGTTTVDPTGSLHSKDHAGVDGDLNIWGAYVRTTGTESWSYATDFDGVALGSPRRANVRIASSSSFTLSGGTLEMIGNAASTTGVSVQGSGAYAFEVSGGTLNAQYYQFRNMDANGLELTGSPSITSLSNGNFELAVSGGAMIRVDASVIDANASKVISSVAFGTSTGVSSGYNILRSGSPVSAWNFDAHTGNYDGESFDSDGGDACGSIRWDDSACLFVSEAHYRWRNDDGGEGAPDSEWYDVSWSKRKKITIENPTASTQTGFEVQITVPYDADMQSDFDDLRFTDVNGTTSIDYWIESYDVSSQAIVWVEVPSIPANDSEAIHMYYGNGAVSTTGDGDAVFEFFDDFEDGDIAEYSGNTSLFTAGTSFNYTYARGLDTAGNENQKTTTGLYQTGTLTEQGETIRYFQYVDVTQEDEPCTLFGVQGAGDNYAVCLDQYPSEKVIVSEDVISNEEEGSGTPIASTTVSYVDTGWYEVEIDWLTDDSIDVTVYDPNGDLFATVETSDSSLTGGGVGFSYWGQHGGWDYYSVRAYTGTDPIYSISLEQTAGGASWKAAEDTLTSGVDTEENVRLRFSIQNSGSDIETNFRLQVAGKGASLSCEAVPHGSFSDVPLDGSCGSSPACMAASANFSDLAPTTELLSSPASMSFVAGSLVENPSNESSLLSVLANRVTEVEYNFEMTTSAVANAYCFRVSDAGSSLDNYDRVAELQMVHSPFITNWSLNNGQSITLTEGATTTVSATGTVTDFNGYTDITIATSTFYRSDVGASCSANENSCYPESISSCALSDCAGNSCTLTCSAGLQYHADPTDDGSIYAASNWLAQVFVSDSDDLTDIETSLGVELLSLFGLDVTEEIDYGALYVGESSTTTAQTVVANTGNINIDLELEGTNIGGIDVAEQAFATSTFVYAECSICQFLTGVGTPTSLEVDLPKPTSTTTPVTDEVYWGINIPDNTAAGAFQGTNTFWATAE